MKISAVLFTVAAATGMAAAAITPINQAMVQVPALEPHAVDDIFIMSSESSSASTGNGTSDSSGGLSATAIGLIAAAAGVVTIGAAGFAVHKYRTSDSYDVDNAAVSENV
eukprot:Clim_evm9s119 gene=Clim_evmTU9s119